MRTRFTNTTFPKTAFLFVSLLINGQYLSAQPTFRKVNGGSEFDYGNCVLETADKGLCIVGSTSSFGSGNDDLYVIKLDSNSNTEWSKTFDWGRKEYGLSAVITRDHGVAITGYCNKNNFSDSGWDAFVLKLDAKGNVLWNKTIGGTAQDDGRNIIENKLGELLIAGCTRSFGIGLYDVYINKLTPQGDLIWAKTYGTVTDDIAYAITATNNGFAFAGTSNGLKPFVTKCDSSGAVLWSKTIESSTLASGSLGAFNSIVQTSDNGFALTGYTRTATRGYDIINVKLSFSGKITWYTLFGNTGDDKGNSIIQDLKGNYIITGYADYARNNYPQSLNIIKISSKGVLLWDKTITEQLDAVGNSVIHWKNNGYVVTGIAWQNAGGNMYKPDLYLAEFDTLGTICGNAGTYTIMRKVIPHIQDLNFDTLSGGTAASNIVTSYTGGTFSDQCIATFATTITEVDASKGIKPIIKTKAIHLTIVPNPVTNGILALQINNTYQTALQFSVADMKGNILFTQKMQVPSNPIYTTINISKLPQGVYVLKVNDGFTQQSIKFIKAN